MNSDITNTIFSFFLIFGFCYFVNWVIFNKKITDIKDKITNEATIKANKILEEATAKANETIKKAEDETTKAKNELNNIINKINQHAQALERYNQLLKDTYDARIKYNDIKEKLDNISEKYDNQRKRELAKINLIKYRLKNANIVLNEYFFNDSLIQINKEKIAMCITGLEKLSPTISLPLKSLEYQDLRKEIKSLKKEINNLLEEYEKRYRLKSNRSIYKLMVIALQSELQNILLNLKYSNLDKSLLAVTDVIHKYMTIAADGNQTIHPTWVKFIGEIETLFKQAVQIEYCYYVRQMQMKEEQAALKERIRQEAEERRFLLAQEKKIKKEEEKYVLEIQNVQEKLKQEVEEGTIYLLKQRIVELENLLSDVRNKKEEIINLQNGKAGFVYIISNLGSFGENVFKIGMTRRLDPQDRIDELSNASVPFKFDVHSFIFSEDAVSLEAELHKRLDSQRVNKITTRKEFFRCNIDDLEKLVFEIQPSASFIKTMLAEQYRMTLQIEKESLLK